jgi:hypothetical protein
MIKGRKHTRRMVISRRACRNKEAMNHKRLGFMQIPPLPKMMKKGRKK